MSTYIQSSINTASLVNASDKRRKTAQALPKEAKVGTATDGHQGLVASCLGANRVGGQSNLGKGSTKTKSTLVE